jgi:hypothetical protein
VSGGCDAVAFVFEQRRDGRPNPQIVVHHQNEMILADQRAWV